MNICPYIATGIFADTVAEKFSQQIKGILQRNKGVLPELRKVIEEKVPGDYENYYVKVDSEGNLSGPFGDASVRQRKDRANLIIAEVRRDALQQRGINFDSLNKYLRYLAIKDLPLFRETYKQVIEPRQSKTHRID